MFASLGASGSLQAQEQPPRLEVRGLRFDGNRAIDDFTLRISIATSQSAWLRRTVVTRWLGVGARRYFDETEFRRDVFRILLLYRRSGYIDARVDTLVDRASSHVSVTFVIAEGEPVRVDSLAIQGTEEVVSPAQLTRDLPLRVGDPFDRARLAAASDSIRAALQERGRPFPAVYRNFSVQNAERRAQVLFVVDPGPSARVGRIEVLGPPDFDEALVRDVIGFESGARYSQRALYEGQQDLYRLGVFDFVDVRLADTLPDSPNDSLVDVVAQVSRGRLHRIRAGAGYGTNDCFRTLASWTVRNFLSGGRSLDLSASFSKIGTGSPFRAGFERSVCPELGPDRGTKRLDLNYDLTAGLRFPTVFSSRRSATLSVSAERFSEFQAFVRTAIGFNLSVTQQTGFGIPLTISYSMSYGSTEADDAVFCSILNVCRAEDAAIFKEDRLKATAGMLLVRDRSNSPINPTRGTVFTLEGRLAAPVIGSDAEIEFAKGLAEFASYHPVGRNGVIAWRVRWGSIRSPDLAFEPKEVQFIPTEERFYGGGPNTARGFRQNELGPLVHVEETDSIYDLVDSELVFDTTIVDTLVSPTGGNQMAFASLEYRFPLSASGRVGGVLFVDAGRVVAATGTQNPVNLRVTPGAGLRIFTPLGPVRFDVAYNPHGPEHGPLFTRFCVTQERERSCDEEAKLEKDDFSRPLGGGILGLGNVFEFARRLRLNFSIGQAF